LAPRPTYKRSPWSDLPWVFFSASGPLLLPVLAFEPTLLFFLSVLFPLFCAPHSCLLCNSSLFFRSLFLPRPPFRDTLLLSSGPSRFAFRPTWRSRLFGISNLCVRAFLQYVLTFPLCQVPFSRAVFLPTFPFRLSPSLLPFPRTNLHHVWVLFPPGFPAFRHPFFGFQIFFPRVPPPYLSFFQNHERMSLGPITVCFRLRQICIPLPSHFELNHFPPRWTPTRFCLKKTRPVDPPSRSSLALVPWARDSRLVY